MLTLTSKTRFGAMRGCQEQTREGDLGGSPGYGWTERPKADNILLVRRGVLHMGSSQSYDLDHMFGRLTRVDSGHFFFIFFEVILIS